MFTHKNIAAVIAVGAAYELYTDFAQDGSTTDKAIHALMLVGAGYLFTKG